jgi:transposase
MKGLNTVKEIANAVNEYGLDNVPMDVIKKTRNTLKKLKIVELHSLANKCKIYTTCANGRTLNRTKDQWIDLIAQYSHLALIK